MIETTALQQVEELLLLQRVAQRISLTLDLEVLLKELSGHLVMAIDNARLFQREHTDTELLLNELQEAKRIQSSLLPARDPTLAHFTMTGVCLPSRTVGGDWYDFVPMPKGRMGVVVADVAGKSLGAALLMSSTRSILRLVAADGGSPSEVLCRVNRILLDDFPTARFVTMVFAVVDPEERTVVVANAGHPPPLFVDSTGAAFLKTAEGLPLGILEGRFSEHTVRMPPGSRLVLYSDGVVEASSSSFEEYGLARLQQHFVRPGSSLDGLLEDVTRFSADKPLSDDATAVVLEAQE